MSQYSDAIAEQRDEMTQVESDANRRMLRAYDDLTESLDDDLQAITRQIDQARADGEDVHPDWLRRQARYTRLMDQVASSRTHFEQTGVNIITDVQGSAIERGAVHALERERILFHPDAYFEGEDADVFAGNINLPAMENLLGQTGPSSPLMGVLESHGDGAVEIITSGLMAGLTGQGADEIYRGIRNQLQSPVARSRLMALVRTEMMNSYRASMHEQFSQFEDEIEGWMWSAHRGPRTCLACLAMDGEVFPMEHPFTQAHVCCRCSASPWPKDVYPSVRSFLRQEGSGEDWIRRLPAGERRKMFPSRDAFEAFERGDLRLKDFVGHTDSPVWGRKIHMVSGTKALKNRGDLNVITPRDEPVRIATLHPAVRNVWRERQSDRVMMTPERRAHILKHRQMQSHLSAITDALDAPREIRYDKDRPHNRVVFYGDFDGVPGKEHIVVIVESKPGRGDMDLKVITAFPITNADYLRRIDREPLLWDGEE